MRHDAGRTGKDLPAFGLATGLFQRTAAGRLRRSLHPRMSSSAPASDPIAAGLDRVRARIAAATPAGSPPATLIAVSKTKPAASVLAAHAAGQLDFGENYVQELSDKASNLPSDIRWHFIGSLQSNKAGALLRVPGLACVQTVDRARIARALAAAAEREGRERLDVFLQVNVDGEDSKAGVPPGEAAGLAHTVKREFPRLRVKGVMAIGRPGETEGFATLRKVREEVAGAIGVEEGELALSMGMSGDFEAAIAAGSTVVRVGSSIFGAREYPAAATARPAEGGGSGT